MIAINYSANGDLEAILKMSIGPMSLLVPRFPALRDGPSYPILLVGLKSPIRLRRTSGFDPQRGKDQTGTRLCVENSAPPRLSPA